MTWWQAAVWGLIGGGSAALLSLTVAIVSGGYTWPWDKKKGQLWPRLFVLAAGLVMGSAVAAAAHDQISGPWPAFIFGVGAPTTLRGLLSGVQVGPQPHAAPERATIVKRYPTTPETGEVREDAP